MYIHKNGKKYLPCLGTFHFTDKDAASNGCFLATLGLISSLTFLANGAKLVTFGHLDSSNGKQAVRGSSLMEKKVKKF